MIATTPECGHYRGWETGLQTDGWGDWEKCDNCGRLVCFGRDGCQNEWLWRESDLLCVECWRKGNNDNRS